MTLADFLRLLQRGWLVVVALTVLGLGAAAAATAMTPPLFGAGATLLVSAPPTGDGTGQPLGNDFYAQRALTYASLATSTALLDGAAVEAGESVEALEGSVSATARTGTAVIDVVGYGQSAAEAADRANAVADALAAKAPGINGDAAVGVAVVTPAEPPAVAQTPRPRNNIMIGAVVGLALGVGLLVVAQTLDTQLRSAADLPRETRFASITSLPAGGPRPGRGGRPRTTSERRLESFRHLRANLQFSTSARGVIAVAGVTSSSDAGGVARELAAVLGEIGLRVVVVDIDLRVATDNRRRRRENVATEPGVADILSGTVQLKEVLVPGAADGVWAVGPGNAKESSAQLISTVTMATLLDELGSQFDYVLLACPSLVERSEASVAAALSGSALVVVESGQTKRADFLYAMELLAGVGVTSPSVAIDHVRGGDMGSAARPAPLFDEALERP